MATRPRGFGLTAEVNRKINEKYDERLEQQARSWIEQILGEELVSGEDQDRPLGMYKFQAALKDGQVLCRLINAISPGSVKKINTKGPNFLQMENIGKFIDACAKYGVPTTDLFHTAALFENTNMTQVVNTIHALGRKAQANGYDGPVLGVKESESNPRNFSEEKLREGHAVIGLQMGSTKGANQQGINFGKSRSITD
ncbi:myophilin-like [Babylonia areolata]|uniref:myophilin-like n=1 Tax=Babylonia areolata TaxID=304850 RepID=UPI003FD35FC6